MTNKKLRKPKFTVFSNYRISAKGLSGGDRILLELVKNWKNYCQISFWGNPAAISSLKGYGIKSIKTQTIPGNTSEKRLKNYGPLFLSIHTLKSLISGTYYIVSHRQQLKNFDYFYATSDFLPDSIPGLIAKILCPKIKLISSFFLFAPSPFSKTNPYRSSLSLFSVGIIYWLIQKISFPLIAYFSDFVFVTSKPDKQKFLSSFFNKAKLITVRGGVAFIPTKQKMTSLMPPPYKRKYQAVFLGRLHYQKGVLELIDIWKLVTQKIPTAKLAIIGNGPLENKVKSKINQYQLKNNIKMFGFLNGPPKHRIFAQSKIALHPATYDSGGMALAEAMAWGLPAVSFNLKALKTYYPHGVLKTPCFNKVKFSHNIIHLLSQKTIYDKLSYQSRKLVLDHWNWPKRAATIYSQVTKTNPNR